LHDSPDGLRHSASILSGTVMRPREIVANSFDVKMALNRVNQTPGGLRRTASIQHFAARCAAQNRISLKQRPF